MSKKSGKPYAMLTLEDLEGSIQVLCMNENYDQYRDLFVVGKAILIIGEVNTGDDRPKLFPQEIMPLEDAPQKFTRQVHMRLHTAHLTPDGLDKLRGVTSEYPGKCPLFLCFRRPTGEVIFIEAHEKYFVTPSTRLAEAADQLFGEDTFYAKVDTSLPERVQKKWERRGNGGSGGDGGE